MNNQFTIEENDIYEYFLYKAELTIWFFNSLLENKYSAYNAVKFKDENEIYVWLENLVLEDEYYHGVLSDNHMAHKIHKNEVIDWMIIENGRLIGGYTIRHYFNMLNVEDKLNFEIDFGVKIDYGNDYFKPELSTPEGAIMLLEEYYNQKNMDGIMSCKDFYAEARNVLTDNDIEITDDLAKTLANVLKTALTDEISSNGYPSFVDIEREFFRLDQKMDRHEILIEEKIIHHDGFITINKFWVKKSENNIWKVLNLIDD